MENIRDTTFGGYQSGINLVVILKEIGDKGLFRKVARLYFDYTRGIRLIYHDMSYSDVSEMVGEAWLFRSIRRAELLQAPPKVISHLVNTMKTIYKVHRREQLHYRIEDERLRRRYMSKIAAGGSWDYPTNEEWKAIREKMKEGNDGQ